MRISVVIPTRDRPGLLAEALESLARQELAPGDFEVIVIDDGPGEGASKECAAAADRGLTLRHVPTDDAGLPGAKNLGLSLSSAPLVFFFDDDDKAAPDLLAAHVEAHRLHPEENVAVLGHTEWAPELSLTELMRYVTGEGGQLFSYRSLRPRQRRNYTYFWGGRTSCKRTLLVDHGIHDTSLRAGLEDIELGLRLAEHGLEVVYWPEARQYANRAHTFETFCRRSETQGKARWKLLMLHPDPGMMAYCGWIGAEARWRESEPLLPDKIKRVEELEREEARGALTETLRTELLGLYGWCFQTLKTKGMVEASRNTDGEETAC